MYLGVHHRPVSLNVREPRLCFSVGGASAHNTKASAQGFLQQAGAGLLLANARHLRRSLAHVRRGGGIGRRIVRTVSAPMATYWSRQGSCASIQAKRRTSHSRIAWTCPSHIAAVGLV